MPITPEQVAKAHRRIAAKRSQALGEWGQRMAQAYMRQLGYQVVDRIETGTRQIGGVRRFTARASGDIRAVGTRGRSVLVEVKVRAERLLRSDLEDHQRKALQAHHEAGGLSLVAWVVQGTVDCHLLPWPVWPDSDRAPGLDADEARRRALSKL